MCRGRPLWASLEDFMKNQFVTGIVCAVCAFAAAASLSSAPAAAQAAQTPPAAPVWPVGVGPGSAASPTYVSIPLEIAVNKPAVEVWKRVGKFCDIAEWLRIATGCTIT